MTQPPLMFPLTAIIIAVATIACHKSSAPQGMTMAGKPAKTSVPSPPAKMEESSEDQISPESLFIHRTIPRLLLVLPGCLPDPSSEDGHRANWLELREVGTSKVFQRLEYPWFGGMSEPGWAEAVDLDGDGYMDLQAPAVLCATQGYFFAWLFRPKQRQFEAVPNFEDIPSPEPYRKGRLRSWYRTGPCSGIETLYTWRKGRLVEIRTKEYTSE